MKAGDTLELRVDGGDYVSRITLNIELTGLGFSYLVLMNKLKSLHQICMNSLSIVFKYYLQHSSYEFCNWECTFLTLPEH